MARLRVTALLLGCVLAHTLWAAAQVPEHLLPKTVAASLFQSFEWARLGRTIEEWRDDDRGSAFCREYQPTTFGGDADGDSPSPPEPWALWCKKIQWSGFREWVFFAVRSSQAFEARLEQSRWVVQGDPAWLADVHLELAARFQERFGPGLRPDRGPGESGLEWQDIRQWGTDDLEIFLYRTENAPLSRELVIRVRTRALVEAIETDRELDLEATLHNPLEPRFLSEAGQRYPSIRELLKLDPTGGPAGDMQEPVRTAAQQVLADLRAAPPPEQPLLMLVLDRLASLILHFDPTPPAMEPSLGPALQAQLDLRFERTNDIWWYPGTLRRAVANTYPNTEWGDYAFLEMLLDGFGTNSIEDPATPAAVVERGTAFLLEKPTFPHRPLILFAVALASETLWSLSIAPAHDECIDDSHGQNVAEKQKQAIAAYEAVVKALGRPEPRSQFASRQIVRVRAGFDTGARYFFDCYP